MESAVIYVIILGVISGLSEGAGVLPGDLIKAAVGDTVTFTTKLTPPYQPFMVVTWSVGLKTIITSITSSNTTDPGYKDRITLFRSTGSLELRNVSFNDSGEYNVTIVANGTHLDGVTRLDVYDKSPASCSDGCIAGIVIACSAAAGASAGGGYYIYKKKINRNHQPHVTELQEENVYEGMDNTSVIYENTK